MKNIELQLAKPYSRDENATLPHKVTSSIEFDNIVDALKFMRELNLLVIRFNDRKVN